jgi:quinohemoprotein ethanol dehydrogenase
VRFGMTVSCSLALLIALVACTNAPASLRVDDARLIEADKDSANWLTYGRTYSEQRFSPLREISDATVGRLGLVWSHELPTSYGLEATPIVLDGVLYTTSSWSVVYAFDAGTGHQLWTYDPKVDRTRTRTVCCDVVNRGLALYQGNLYLGTLDGRLVAINAQTGIPAWDVVTVDQSKPYAITGAPRVAKGRVLIGNAGGEFGVRGYVSAYDAATGKLAWRVYTVPGDPAQGLESKAMEAAARTWNGEYWKAGGGGPVWDTIVYDPELDLVYFGTGNGTAWYRDLRSPRWRQSLSRVDHRRARADWRAALALSGDPRRQLGLRCHSAPHARRPHHAGTPRKVVMQASKNGFFYVIDRRTGQLISATPFVDGITWATRIDSVTGRPMESPSAYAGTKAVLVSPDPEGAHNWYPMAFDASKGLVFLGVRSGSLMLHAPNPRWESDISALNLGIDWRYEGELVAKRDIAPAPRGELLAWNPVERSAAWRVSLPVSQSGGLLATAANLVFQGRADGIFTAYRATDGSKLWEFDAGTGIMAPPVTYLVGRKQYLTVMVGWGGPMGLFNFPNMGPVRPGFGRVLTFALDGTATFAPPPYGHRDPPVPAVRIETTAAAIREGEFLYHTHCFSCHGLNVIAGPIPDLRYSTADTHTQFETIVLGGARKALGMPSFADKLNSKELRAIEAYVLSRAEAARNETPR